jgi:hypothetical protein
MLWSFHENIDCFLSLMSRLRFYVELDRGL